MILSAETFKIFNEALLDFIEEISMFHNYELDFDMTDHIVIRIIISPQCAAKLAMHPGFVTIDASKGYYQHGDYTWEIYTDVQKDDDINDKQIECFEELLEEYLRLVNFFDDTKLKITLFWDHANVGIIETPFTRLYLRNVIFAALNNPPDYEKDIIEIRSKNVYYKLYLNSM